jgi:hypothetical protein
VNYQPRTGEIEAQRRARRLWLTGTMLMAAVPLKFAVAALLDPQPLDPGTIDAIQRAVLVPPAWLAQLVGPIDHALRTSSLSVLPTMVVLFFLLRMWFGYGRRLFKPAPANRG